MYFKNDMNKIILTGAAGFVGSNVARKLLEHGYMIACFDDLRFGNEKNSGDIEFIQEDFNNIPQRLLDEADILIHCATSNIIYAMDKPIETFQNNATNTIKLFKKFKGKIIYTSTASVYGQADVIPTPEDAEIRLNNAYDQSKYIAELFLQQRGNYTTVRLSNVYGPNQRPDNPYCGVMGKLIHCSLNYQPIKINGHGTQTRDYTYIDDVVQAIMLAIIKPAQNTEINIATQQENDILSLINIIRRLTNKTIISTHIESRKIDGITRRALDISKAKELLSWQPEVTLEEGIKKTILWIQNLK